MEELLTLIRNGILLIPLEIAGAIAGAGVIIGVITGVSASLVLERVEIVSLIILRIAELEVIQDPFFVRNGSCGFEK